MQWRLVGHTLGGLGEAHTRRGGLRGCNNPQERKRIHGPLPKNVLHLVQFNEFSKRFKYQIINPGCLICYRYTPFSIETCLL